MQAEIDRMVQEKDITTEDGLPITKESLEKMNERLAQFSLGYLEKDREISVLKSEFELTKESFESFKVQADKDHTALTQSLSLTQRELDTLRSQLANQGDQSLQPDSSLIH